jgi:hypothetical protein
MARGRGDLRSQSEYYDTAMRCLITPRTVDLSHTYRFRCASPVECARAHAASMFTRRRSDIGNAGP